jgi:hypothetical protein
MVTSNTRRKPYRTFLHVGTCVERLCIIKIIPLLKIYRNFNFASIQVHENLIMHNFLTHNFLTQKFPDIRYLNIHTILKVQQQTSM